MPRPRTPYGTPCSPRWKKPWIIAISLCEQHLRRPICGATRSDDTPCTNPSNHPTGRCPKHGGVPGIGGQKGNTNALIHGLYARADLQIIGKKKKTAPYPPESKHYRHLQHLKAALKKSGYSPDPSPRNVPHTPVYRMLEAYSALERATCAAFSLPTNPKIITKRYRVIFDAYIRISQEFRRTHGELMTSLRSPVQHDGLESKYKHRTHNRSRIANYIRILEHPT